MASKTVQLLLVEDDLADAKFLRACLARSKGSKPDITHAQCLNDALALLQDTRFDVILLDLNLPDATGEVSVSKIQDACPKIPIVILSGEDNEDYAIGILNQGVQDYLVKWDGEGATILRSIRYAIERKRTELRLTFLATYDSLTEIPNRNFFVEHLNKAVSRAQRNGTLLGLVFLDLDRFKGVNDTLGHYFGDRLLCAVAKRISAAVRNGDIVARMGGDEFAILLENMNDTQAAEAVARKLTEVLAEPYELDGGSVNITVSVGITIYPKDHGDPETLVKNADMAMYQAKSAGRNGYQFFNEKMHDEIVRQHEVAQELRRALDNREFSLLYQPQLRLDDGRLDGAEALIRWNHPQKNLVMPNDFIGIAEESGQIVQVGNWVIEEAFRQSLVWQTDAAAPPRMAINISPRQIHQPSFYPDLKRLLITYGVNPEHIEIEITESCLIEDVQFVQKSLQKLKDLGFTLAIDDFGTGHSCLDYLRRFPIDILKIDRSFVKDIGSGKHGTAICRAILSIADGLNMETVGEGIETEEQLQFLIDNGCHRGQGYYFSPAVKPEDLATLITHGTLNQRFSGSDDVNQLNRRQIRHV